MVALHDQLHAFAPGDRLLGEGVEAAQRLDLVAEGLDPHRLGRGPGIDVEQASTDGELARRLDRLGQAIALVDQTLGQSVQVVLVAGADFQAVGQQGGQIRDRLLDGPGRGQQELAGRELFQSRAAPGQAGGVLDLRVGLLEEVELGQDLGRHAQLLQVVGQTAGIVGDHHPEEVGRPPLGRGQKRWHQTAVHGADHRGPGVAQASEQGLGARIRGVAVKQRRHGRTPPRRCVPRPCASSRPGTIDPCTTGSMG